MMNTKTESSRADAARRGDGRLSSSRRLGALLAMTLLGAGCDAEPEPGPRSTLDLTRHGISDVHGDEDGTHYVLLGLEGEIVGEVERAEVTGGASLSIELYDTTARISWPDPTTIECAPGHDSPSTADEIAACSRELAIASELAEADGFDVPGFEPSARGVEFRDSCVTVETWVSGGSCDNCFREAKHQSGKLYPNVGGTCSPGTLWTTCSGTYCDSPPLEGGSEF